MKAVETLSVAEMCDEIREAPFYDDNADITQKQLASAYERLLEVSRELVGWLEGTENDRYEITPACEAALAAATKGGSES